MRFVCEQGSLVQVSLPGTSVHGRLGVIDHTLRKTAKWPMLYVVHLDLPPISDSDTVTELHLMIGEVLVLG